MLRLGAEYRCEYAGGVGCRVLHDCVWEEGALVGAQLEDALSRSFLRLLQWLDHESNICVHNSEPFVVFVVHG